MVDPASEFADTPVVTPRKLPLVLAVLTLPVWLLTVAGAPFAAPFGVALSVITLWMTELLPVPVTGLLVPLLSILFGVSTVKQAFAPFGNEILALFLGCFLLSAAMARHGFDKRLAGAIIGGYRGKLTGRSLGVLITGTAFFLSMWMSNTAATIIVVAIIGGFIDEVSARVKDGTTVRNLRLRLLIGAAFGASMGGIGTPIGSPPNLIAIEQLASIGVEVSFLEWMSTMVPLGLLTLVFLFVVFEFRYPLAHLDFSWARGEFRDALRQRGGMSGAERVVALAFSSAVILWLLPDIIGALFPGDELTGALKSRLSLGSVGLIAGLILFIIPHQHEGRWQPTLRWDDAQGIDWGTILLFGGGLALGEMLERTGAAKAAGTFVVGLGFTDPVMLLLLLVLLSVLVSEFASNTAAAAIMLPLIVGLSANLPAMHGLERDFILAATVGASFGFMLPVSTPPNAIIFGTGQVPARELMRTGVLFDVLGILLAVVYFLL